MRLLSAPLYARGQGYALDGSQDGPAPEVARPGERGAAKPEHDPLGARRAGRRGGVATSAAAQALPFQALFEAAPVPCVVLSPRGFTIVAANAAVLRTTGARREDLIGRPLFEAFPASPSSLAPDQRPALSEGLRRVIRSRSPSVLPVVRYDIPAVDAPEAFVERWWSPVVAPVLDERSDVEYLVIQVEDVTDTMKQGRRAGAAVDQEATIARLRQTNVALTRETELRRRTERMLRRAAAFDAYRVRLNDALSRCREPDTALATALEAVVEELGTDLALFAEVDHEAGAIVVRESYVKGGRVDFVGSYAFGPYPDVTQGLARGQAFAVADASSDEHVDERVRDAMLSYGLCATVIAPVTRSGRWEAIMSVACLTPRPWQPDEVALIEETAQRAWAAAEAMRAERRLRQNAETFERLIVNAPFGVYVVDADLRIVLASRTAHETFGVQPDLIGKDLGEALRAIWFPDFVDGAVASFERTLETGERFASKDTVQLRADRNVVEAYDWRLERIVMPDGRYAVVCYYYDLTERQRLEDLLRQREEELRRLNVSLERMVERRTQELRDSEARFSRAFSDAPVAACIVTIDDERVIEVNQAFVRLTGYAVDEAVGRRTAELGLWSGPEDSERIARALEGADGYRELELKVTRKDGEVLDVLGSASLISWGGEPVRLKMFIDNTANKRAQEQVSRAIKDVMAEAAWFSRNIVERLSRAGDPNRHREPAPELTPREQQVLARIALGMTDKAIAEELGVSHQTVRNHVARIYQKIKVHSRSQAVVWAREKGIPGSAVAPT